MRSVLDDRNDPRRENRRLRFTPILDRVRWNFRSDSTAILYSYVNPEGIETFCRQTRRLLFPRARVSYFLPRYFSLPPDTHTHTRAHARAYTRAVIHGLDLNFRYLSPWQRNIHRRIATGSQRCGITDQIKNQYFPLETLRSGPRRSDITTASFAFNANLIRFRGSNSDQFSPQLPQSLRR